MSRKSTLVVFLHVKNNCTAICLCKHTIIISDDMPLPQFKLYYVSFIKSTTLALWYNGRQSNVNYREHQIVTSLIFKLTIHMKIIHTQ